ncbi:hypothetical protein DM01DRAFT_1384722 [Hesseltinella vesiculosa]|uniref:Uncharacterized protein n=1 Tax=Hesseltinella vesiculosa TaxID=101127 RepID=A0A1X2GC79_9FUNG|nr:hypothetical protein DM01DRAFT_1384722 [Hesseltinella vesiculosa]
MTGRIIKVEEDMAQLQYNETYDFERYDQAMYDVYQQEEELDQVQQETNEKEEEHDDSSLLRLIVGVQMYLSEQPCASIDTPLMDLQYKMYTFLKQKACELGVDASVLNQGM